MVSPPRVHANARGPLTSSIQITNNFADTTNIVLTAENSMGWQIDLNPPSLRLASGESGIVFLSTMIPSGTPAGEYLIDFKAAAEGDESSAVGVQIEIEIAERPKIEVQSLQINQQYASTSDISVQSYYITNRGNSPAQIELDIDSFPNWSYTLDPPERRFELLPNDSRTIQVTLMVPDVLDSSVSHRLTVIARQINALFPGTEGRATTATMVVPKNLSGDSIFWNLEGDITAQESVREGEGHAQSLSVGPLYGDLGGGRSVVVDLHNVFLSGSMSSSFIHGQRLYAEYMDENYGVLRAGDFVVDCGSPLIERYTWVRGGDILMDHGGQLYHIFYTNRNGSIDTNFSGLQWGMNFNEESDILVTLLRSSNHERFDSDRIPYSTLGLALGYEPTDDLSFNGEIAKTLSTQPGKDIGWRLTGKYNENGVVVGGEWLHAGKGYFGGWNDTELRRLNLRWSPIDDLSLWTNYNLGAYNISHDTDTPARNIRTLTYGASYNLDEVGRFYASKRLNRNIDVLLDRFNLQTSNTTLSFARNWGDITTILRWEEQIENDRITESQTADRTFHLDSSTFVEPNTSLKLDFSAGRVTQGNGGETDSKLGVDFTGRTWLGPDLDFFWGIRRTVGGFDDRRTNIYGNLSWDIFNGQDINLALRRYSGLFGHDTEVMLEYDYPISIPLTNSPRYGVIQGRVSMSDDPSRGVSDARISIDGIEVLTDEDGNFKFPSIDPGDYELTLDPISLAIGLSTGIEMPVFVSVIAGETTEVVIPITEMAGISGIVLVEKTPDSGEPTVGPFEGAVIEIKGEGVSKFINTDSDGHFFFTDLQPGKYKVILHMDRLPGKFDALNPDVIEMDLIEGESPGSLTFKIKPTVRNIVYTTNIFDLRKPEKQ
jgi:hypothetical protein